MLSGFFFTGFVHGIPGDEDGGGMSAFWSSRCLGSTRSRLDSHLRRGQSDLPKATIHLKNGKDFVILAQNTSHNNKYVRAFD